MTTHYLPAGHGASFPRYGAHYSGAAALVQAITAAAALAPESAPVISRAFPDGAYDAPHNSRVWVSADGNGSGYWQEWHGPVMPDPGPDPDYMPRVAFHYIDANGTRGAMTLLNLRASLTAAAERVHKARAAFDGKVKRVTHKRAASSSAPHVAARELWADRQRRDALALAENVGAIFFGASGKPGDAPHPYMGAQSIDAAGHGFTVARSIVTGKFRVLHTVCAASVDGSIVKGSTAGFSSASDALSWLETESQCDAWRAKLNAAADKMPGFDQAAARAFYFADEPDDETSQDAPQAREPAADEPMVQDAAPDAPSVDSGPLPAAPCSPDEYDSDPEAWDAIREEMRDKAQRRSQLPAVADAIGAALLARYGVTDPAACAHLPGFAAEFARIRSECGAPAANDAAPVDPGPDAPPAAAAQTERAAGPDAAAIAGLMARYAAAIAPVVTPGYAFPGAAACPPATHSEPAPAAEPPATQSRKRAPGKAEKLREYRRALHTWHDNGCAGAPPTDAHIPAADGRAIRREVSADRQPAHMEGPDFAAALESGAIALASVGNENAYGRRAADGREVYAKDVEPGIVARFANPPAPLVRAPRDGDRIYLHELPRDGSHWQSDVPTDCARDYYVRRYVFEAFTGSPRWATCADTGAFLYGMGADGRELKAAPAGFEALPPATHSQAAPDAIPRATQSDALAAELARRRPDAGARYTLTVECGRVRRELSGFKHAPFTDADMAAHAAQWAADNQANPHTVAIAQYCDGAPFSRRESDASCNAPRAAHSEVAAPLEFVSQYTGPRCNGFTVKAAQIECAKRQAAEPDFVFTVQAYPFAECMAHHRWKVSRFRRVAPGAPPIGQSEAPPSLDVLRAANESATQAAAAIDAATSDPAARIRMLRSEAQRFRESARNARWPLPDVGRRYDCAAAMLNDTAAMREAHPAPPLPAWPAMVASAHHAARGARPHPLLRIPAGDPRLRIPARFAPVYLLQGAAQ